MRSSYRTSVDTFSVAVPVGIVGITYGMLAHQHGFPTWAIIGLAVTVLGASAELLFVGLIGTGTAPLLAAIAAITVNARNLAYCATASRFLTPGISRILGAHLANDESIALATASRIPARQRRAFWSTGLAIAATWPAGAAAGAYAGDHFDLSATALGLDAVFPVLLIAVAQPILGEHTELRAPAIVSAGTALGLAGWTPAGLSVIGGAAVGLALLMARRRGSA